MQSGKDRSKTCSELFNGEYAGIYSNEKPLTKELLFDADLIICMEEDRDLIAEKFSKEYIVKRLWFWILRIFMDICKKN